MKRLLVLFILFFAFNVFAQLRLSYEKVEVTLENAADVVRSLTAPTGLEVSGTITPVTKSYFDKLVDEIRTQKNLIHLDLSKVEGLKEIESKKFVRCKNLTGIVIPDSVITIGKFVFDDCNNLTNVTLGKNVAIIGYGAFGNCDNLRSIVIPDSVTSIGKAAFSYCKDLGKFEVGINNKRYSSSDDGKILYNKDKTELIAYPSAFEKVIISNNVTIIGDAAFRGCKKLTSVVIPDSVTTIREYAFSYCENLKTVNYKGTAEQWKKISIGLGNEYLTNATINYNYSE